MIKNKLDKLYDKLCSTDWALISKIFFAIVISAVIINYVLSIRHENIEQKEKIEDNENKVNLEGVYNDNKKLLVHIKGEVNNPDVYEFEYGTRVSEAIEAAGGFTENADKDSVNLAEKVKDEMEIEVKAIKEAKSTKSTSTNYKKSTSKSTSTSSTAVSKPTVSVINVNTAGVSDFVAIGVNQAVAENIVSYRNYKGYFSSCSELMRVDGVTQGLYNSIAAYLTL